VRAAAGARPRTRRLRWRRLEGLAGHDDRDDDGRQRLHDRRTAEARCAQGCEADVGARPVEDLHGHDADQLRQLHDRSRRQDRAGDDGIVRLPGFIIQGGDPTASGLGGPGYSTVDKPPQTARYTLGTVAMAKTQAEPDGTSGSQFFIVTAQDAQLPPQYAIVGEVKDGLDTVTKIGELGDASTEQPTEIVEIQKATVSSE
jgi:cyclophilin family peptidyl-prolyl cis-trans isomerase